MLSLLRFKSFILFGTRVLLDKSLRVLQIPHIYLNQPKMDSNVVPNCINWDVEQ